MSAQHGNDAKQHASGTTSSNAPIPSEFTGYRYLWLCRAAVILLAAWTIMIMMHPPLMPYRFVVPFALPIVSLLVARFFISIVFFLEPAWQKAEKLLLAESDTKATFIAQLDQTRIVLSKLLSEHKISTNRLLTKRDNEVRSLGVQLKQFQDQREKETLQKDNLWKSKQLITQHLTAQRDEQLSGAKSNAAGSSTNKTWFSRNQDADFTAIYAQALAHLDKLTAARSNNIDAAIQLTDHEERKKLSACQVRIDNLSTDFKTEKNKFNKECEELIASLEFNRQKLLYIRRCLQSYTAVSPQRYISQVLFLSKPELNRAGDAGS